MPSSECVNIPVDGEHRPDYDDSNIRWTIYFPFFLDKLSGDMRKHMTIAVENYGLTSAHAIYLISLYLEGSKTQKELTEYLDLDPANTFRVIKTLKDRGYVYDGRETPSSRNCIISLTESGKKISKQVIASTTRWMDELLSDFHDSELSALKTTLAYILLKVEPDLYNKKNMKSSKQTDTYLKTIVEDASEGPGDI